MSKPRTSSSIARRGLLFVLSSPSGAGKTTLSKRLLEREKDMVMSVSVTTRKPRPGEVDGTDYYFISRARFDEMVENGELLEHADVFGNGYGTPLEPVLNWIEKGKDVLFDVDWQGTQQIHSKMPADVVRVFILPPSATELRDRLFGRNLDEVSVIKKRMSEASNELGHWDEYDYALVNDEVDECSRDVAAILKAERLKKSRRVGLADFVQGMRKQLSPGSK